MAVSHADNPELPVISLKAEREACGIADPALDKVAANAESNEGTYAIPDARHLGEILTVSLKAMLAPLAIADPALHATYERRLTGVLGSVAALDGDFTSGQLIGELTSGQPRTGDGVHPLVMDLHKELNRLIANLAEIDIDGAHAYLTTPEDKPLVVAFMAGLSRTAPLKFDHPGLTTTAMRSGGRLVIQNDIGETAAHVLVIAIDGSTVTIHYSDVHTQRLSFFESMLQEAGLAWGEMRPRQASGLGEDNLFYALSGTYVAPDAAGLMSFLDRVGSRIVFLIDWNKARKRLGLLVPNGLAIELLGWAAERGFGHRAFLQLGGERLVYDALERAVRTPLRYGEPLHEMIGAEGARDFLRFVLEATSTGLKGGLAETLIADRIRVELFNHFRTAEQRLLGDAARHAGLVSELARGVQSALSGKERAANATVAKSIESAADGIVNATRTTARRIAGTSIFSRVVEVADDAADELEDAAFLTGLLTVDAPQPLTELSRLLVAGSAAYRRYLDLAPGIHRGAAREHIDRFLAAAEEVVSFEHRTDSTERDVMTALLPTGSGAPQCYLLCGIAHHLESAMDALLHACLMLRDHILGDITFA
jgi:uncharacterized protein Yka (UPF0111/DUF47 family)